MYLPCARSRLFATISENPQRSSITHRSHQTHFSHSSSSSTATAAAQLLLQLQYVGPRRGHRRDNSRHQGRAHSEMSQMGTPSWDTRCALLVSRVRPVVRSLLQQPREICYYSCGIEGFGGVHGRKRHRSCTLKGRTARGTARGDRSPTGGQLSGGQ